MHIGVIAPPWVTVPPAAYGGTESVVDALSRGLVAAGHDVDLFTVGSSPSPVPRLSVFDEPQVPMNSTVPELRHVQAAYREFGGHDVIHDHTVIGPVWAAAAGVRVPVVCTWHGSFTGTNRPLLVDIGRWSALVAISHRQRQLAPEVPVTAVVHHGMDAEALPEGRGDGGYLLFVGRMSKDKGVDAAARIARRAGVPLRIAAKMREPEEVEYFHRHVEPVLGDGVTLLGEIGPDERDRLLGGALALLNPIAWEEPFGMVMLEALSCGTPVIAHPLGAAPEIVCDGVTGFLAGTEDDAVAAVGRVGSIDRSACRRSVIERFSVERMVHGYEAVYRRARSAVDSAAVIDLRTKVVRDAWQAAR